MLDFQKCNYTFLSDLNILACFYVCLTYRYMSYVFLHRLTTIKGFNKSSPVWLIRFLEDTPWNVRLWRVNPSPLTPTWIVHNDHQLSKPWVVARARVSAFGAGVGPMVLDSHREPRRFAAFGEGGGGGQWFSIFMLSQGTLTVETGTVQPNNGNGDHGPGFRCWV